MKFGKWMEMHIMSLSAQEREKRKHMQYLVQRKQLLKLTEDELDFKYFTTKAQYEHRKNLFYLFLVGVLFAVFSNVWELFYEFLTMYLQMMAMGEPQTEKIMKSGFLLCAGLFFFFVVCIFLIAFFQLKTLHKLHMKLLILENIFPLQN